MMLVLSHILILELQAINIIIYEFLFELYILTYKDLYYLFCFYFNYIILLFTTHMKNYAIRNCLGTRCKPRSQKI
jgi:hypothetical protein